MRRSLISTSKFRPKHRIREIKKWGCSNIIILINLDIIIFAPKTQTNIYADCFFDVFAIASEAILNPNPVWITRSSDLKIGYSLKFIRQFSSQTCVFYVYLDQWSYIRFIVIRKSAALDRIFPSACHAQIGSGPYGQIKVVFFFERKKIGRDRHK